MKISPILFSFLESSIQNYLFNGWSLLIIKQSKIVCELSNLRHDCSWMSESISNSNTFQSCKESLIILCLFKNLLSDGWGIFTAITLSKNNKWLIGFKFELTETSWWILIKFFQSSIKICRNTIHWSTINIFESLIGIT